MEDIIVIQLWLHMGAAKFRVSWLNPSNTLVVILEILEVLESMGIPVLVPRPIYLRGCLNRSLWINIGIRKLIRLVMKDILGAVLCTSRSRIAGNCIT